MITEKSYISCNHVKLKKAFSKMIIIILNFHGNGPYCKILNEKESIRAQGFA